MGGGGGEGVAALQDEVGDLKAQLRQEAEVRIKLQELLDQERQKTAEAQRLMDEAAGMSLSLSVCLSLSVSLSISMSIQYVHYSHSV